MDLVTVRELYRNREEYLDKEVTIGGWVRSIRDSKAFGFIVVNDGSFFEPLQVVYHDNMENFGEISKLNVGAAIIVKGTLVATPQAKQPFEIQATEVTVEGASAPDYPLQKKRHSFEYLRSIAHLRPRTNTFQAVFRVRSLTAYAIHKFFQERGFVYVHTPLITGSDCEGAGEMFQVTTMDLNNVPKNADGSVDYSKDFFGKETNLTVSGQLNGETYAQAFRDIYTFGPTFRAENSNTTRHAAEFWMIEPEIAFADLEDDMILAESMLKYVIRYVKPHIPTMIFGFTIKFTGTILDLMIPYILSYIIDEVTPRNDIGLVIRWGLMMAVCAALVLVCNVWANRVASAVSRDSIEALRHDLFYKISYLSSSQVDTFTIPSLVTRMTTDTYNLHRTLNMIQRMGVRAPILMLGGVVVTMFIDPWLSAILCFLIPFMILAVARISRKSIPLFGKAQIAADAMIRVVRENATGIRVIKALSRTEYEKDRYETVNSRLNAAEAKASITMAASGPLINLMLNTGLAAVIVVGAWRVSTGAMKPGAIVAFLTYFTIILNSVMAISRLITMSSKAIASAGRVEEVMMTPQDMEIRPWTGRSETAPGASPDAPDMAYGKRPPHMEFDHVSFSYNKRAYNLSDLSFSLEHGQSLGIIGPTGAGKSTLAQLLLRLYDIDSGQIRIDGRDISTFPLKELRQKFGVVFQNDVLFKDSLLNNIDMGRKLDMDAIDRAVEVAQAASFIAGSGGYEKPIAVKGVNLSGGQKQRVLIARALAGRPEFLILDDSSSALDYKTDAAFRQSLAQSFSGTTTIIIAQRISSIMHCDKILVLEDGIPQGLGTHEELLKTCDAYREISTIQMGGEDL